MQKKGVHIFVISTFVLLYVVVSIISTIHVIDFFDLSNPKWLSVCLAIAFEIGAAASLASIIVLDKMNKFVIWTLFILLTAMQAMGNTYFAYTHLSDFTQWSELFGLIEEDIIFQKRILAIISGAILPLVSLGFIKSLVDYIRPSEEKNNQSIEKLEIQKEEENMESPGSNENLDILENKEEIQEIESSPLKEITQEKIEELPKGDIDYSTELPKSPDVHPKKLRDTIYYDLDPTKL
jgi:hypothetical protein